MEEHVIFPCGDISLEGILRLPPIGPRGGAVLCHPHPQYGGNMDNNVVVAVEQGLRIHRLATLRFNFRGVGRSEGCYGGGEKEKEDVKAALHYLRQRLAANENALTVVGYSFGATVGLPVGATEDEVFTIVGIGPPLPYADFSFLRTCAKPKLLIIGEHDTYCPLARLQELFEKLPDPKAMSVISGADHFFWGREAEVAQAVVEFLKRE